MSSPDPTIADELDPRATTALLRRILASVEHDSGPRWMEIGSAMLLALATMGSAWCAYQSTLWGGVQTFQLAAASRAGREATEHVLTANQLRMFDGQLVVAYIEAKGRGDDKLAEFVSRRFRPVAKAAFDAWVKSDPLNNPDAPLRPFELKEYDEPMLRESARLDAESSRAFDAAQKANEHSDTYVLLTVLFATVLFFGGIGGSLQSRRLRKAVFVLALVFFAVTVTYLIGMPICHE